MSTVIGPAPSQGRGDSRQRKGRGHQTAMQGDSQALESIPAAEASTFVVESEPEDQVFDYVAPPSHSLDHLQPCTQSL